ncbi:MAG: hypothetical protein SCM11_02140 [Bacillota bacterium]|nr:hypothetical protein [Bacillota bacterium]
MRKTGYFLGVLVLALVLLTGCGHIEDTNGDDPSLVTISRENMVDKSMSWTASGVSTVTKRYHITCNTFYEDIDVDYLEKSNGKISGIANIMATELKEGQTLTIACETGVKSGNIAVILLSPDGEILYDFEIDAYEEVTVIADQTGTGIYMIRIGTESFTGAIILAREFS